MWFVLKKIVTEFKVAWGDGMTVRERWFGIPLFLVLLLFVSSVPGLCQSQNESRVVVNTLVVSDRLESRVSPELYHAFKLAAYKSGLGMDFKFSLFNPNKADVLLNTDEFLRTSQNIYSLILSCVDEIFALPESAPGSSKAEDLFAYVHATPTSNLANAYAMASALLSGYDFLLIEPTEATLAHPFFYVKDAELTTYGANEKDLVETVYGLFFIDYAVKNNMPVVGSCHGAQLGWIYAGGALQKIFDTRKNWMNPAVYVQKNPYGGPLEMWHIDEKDNFLMTEKWGDVTTPLLMKYPLPDAFKKILGLSNDKKIFINKEMQQSLAMLGPAPDGITEYALHPLSELAMKMKRYGMLPSELPKGYGFATQAALGNFKARMFEDIQVVDFYTHKTMIGTQYHPQYVYDDYETSLIFDAYVKFVHQKYQENHQ